MAKMTLPFPCVIVEDEDDDDVADVEEEIFVAVVVLKGDNDKSYLFERRL